MTSMYQEAVRKLQVVGEAPSQPQRVIPSYFDFSRLTPMQEGRARKSLDLVFRYHGDRMTRGAIYARFAPVAKRLGKKQLKRRYTNTFGATMHDWVEAPEYYLVNAQSATLDVPKILYDICTLPVIDRKQTT
jgi:hypothetical protein